MTKCIKNVICTFCGTLCDDLEVDVSDDGKRIEQVRNACAIGAEKYLHVGNPGRVVVPRMRQADGTYKDVSYDEAIDFTAKTLLKAKKPLMYGWSSTNCEAIAEGNVLAEKIGGVVDNCATVCHGSSLLAIQDTGVPSCTLGEVKNRADRIIFWGCNPAHAHPRHMSRYSIFPRGFFSAKGQKGRKIICVDCRETGTAKVADHFVRIKQSYDYEVFDALRTLLRGEEIPDEVGGVPREKLQELIDICKGGRFVTLFFGMGLTHTLGRNHNIDAGINFIRDLNDYTKATLIAMRGHYNVTGAGQVLGWQYGYPFACDLSRLTTARHNPGETTSVDLLVRHEVDACMVIASDLAAHFPFEATRRKAHIPTITLDPHICMSTELSDLHIPVAIVGVEVGGCCYRMDNVPIDTRKVIDAPEGVLTDEEVFQRINKRVDELLAEAGCKDAAEYLEYLEKQEA